MCSIRRTWKNVKRKEHPHRNQDEALLRPGSASLAVRVRMMVYEERGRSKTVSGRDELAEENHRKKYIREKVRNEQTREELGAEETVVQKIKKRRLYSGLDTWKGWRRKDYQIQLYMDM